MIRLAPAPRAGSLLLPLAGGLAVVAVAAWACAPPQTPEDEPPVAEEGSAERAAALVETVTLETTHFREFLELNGETEPVRTAVIASELPGRIVTFDLTEGVPVEEGTLVMRVDSRLPSTQIDQLEVELRQLDTDISRTRRLIERGLANEPKLERLQTQREATELQIDASEINVRQARTTAPISGMVTETMAERGEYANPGVPLARIVDTSTIIVRAGLPERDIRYVHENMEARVRIEATGEELIGTIRRIGVEANTLNRTFPVEIHLDSEGTLRAGMRATVILPKQDFDNVIVIPRDVIMQAVGGQEVFVVHEGTADARPIQLGPGRGRFVVVTDGLSPGDELVVRGHRVLVQGEPVEPVANENCCHEQLQALF